MNVFILSLIMTISDNTVPMEVLKEVVVQEKDIKQFRWNRWANEHLVVCSLNDEQGKYIFENFDTIKDWIRKKWQFPNIEWNKEIRLFCVPNKETMQKLFNINFSKIEIREDLIVGFIILDGLPADVLPPIITELYLQGIENQFKFKSHLWLHRGMGLLSSSPESVRKRLKEYFNKYNGENVFNSKQIFLDVNKENYLNMDQAKKDKFDNQSLMLVLFIKKEFGSNSLNWFIKENELAVNRLGFKSLDEFQESFARFQRDIRDNLDKMPLDYLEP